MTVQELQDLLRRLFVDDSPEFTEIGTYALSFLVPGKAKGVMDQMMTRTVPSQWRGEAGHWFYDCDDEDWSLYLRSIPHSVLCIASVQSLHRRHLEQYRITPEQEAQTAAEEAQSRLRHEEWTAQNIRTGPLKSLGGPFYTDGERVWARAEYDSQYRALNNVDLASFRHLIDHFAVDAWGLRCYTSGDVPRYDDEGQGVIAGGDAHTLQSLGDDWYCDSRQAYYVSRDTYDRAGYHLVVVKADVVSLRFIGGSYARDAKHLYCAGVRKPGIENPGSVVSLGYGYARIGKQILYDGKLVTRPGRIDAERARAVFHDVLIDDDGHMLWGRTYRKPLPGLDAKGLRFLNYFFAADDRYVYLRATATLTVCDWIDRDSLEAVSPFRVRDKDGVIGVNHLGHVARLDESLDQDDGVSAT